ncbi:MAG: hypothetical protein C4325_02240 [Blastocatellia bacterium]
MRWDYNSADFFLSGVTDASRPVSKACEKIFTLVRHRITARYNRYNIISQLTRPDGNLRTYYSKSLMLEHRKQVSGTGMNGLTRKKQNSFRKPSSQTQNACAKSCE